MSTFTKLTQLMVAIVLMSSLTACPELTGNGGTDGDAGEEITSPDEAFEASLEDMADALLALINDERIDAGLPELERDPGLDEIMLWYGTDMVLDHHISHIDINGRESEGRVNYYSDRTDVRCSEITAWWGGASAESHYEAYKASEGHHAAYMEEGIFNLGPTTHVGVVVLSGTGPEGSAFEDRSGTYSGLVFCDDAVDVEIDPFDE